MYRRWTQNLWTIFALIFYCCLIGRLFFIQVIQKSKYQSFAEKQSRKTITLLPERGIIFDRNFKTLARDVNQFSFGVDPDQLEDKQLVAKTFSKATGISIQYYQKLLKKDKFVWLARGMDPRMSSAIKFGRANPVTKVTEKGRFYPYQNAAANVIGLLYMQRTRSWIRTHRKRAKAVLGEYAPNLAQLDSITPEKHEMYRLGRGRLMLILHVVLTLMAGGIIIYFVIVSVFL